MSGSRHKRFDPMTSIKANFEHFECVVCGRGFQSASKCVKFIYSEKAAKFYEISIVDLSYVVTVKSTVEISQNFVAFSEYMNFNLSYPRYFI